MGVYVILSEALSGAKRLAKNPAVHLQSKWRRDPSVVPRRRHSLRVTLKKRNMHE
jgi:hypothetical protein